MPESLPYFIFVLFVLALFRSVRPKARMYVLLAASLFFYYWLEPRFFLVLVLQCVTSWTAGKFMGKFPARKKTILGVFLFGLIIVFLPLKYFETFRAAGHALFGEDHFRWLYLPLGLSFYTFQVLSYVFDVFYEKIPPEENFLKYTLYISFFPQLICGPIERTEKIVSQIEHGQTPSGDSMRTALGFIVTGLFKKKVLADSLNFILMPAYANSMQLSGLEWLIMAILTRFYIYYDFSGYTDIAIGVARFFGIRLTNNFNRPFASTSIADFWRRWHITLSNWIRDYVFYPLVSLNSRPFAIYLSLVLSFLFLGVWHGEHFNFVLYGLINGTAVAINVFLDRKRKNKSVNPVVKGLKRAGLLVFLICLPSLLLISDDFQEFAKIFSRLLSWNGWFQTGFIQGLQGAYVLWYVIPLLLLYQIFDIKSQNGVVPSLSKIRPHWQYALLVVLVFITFLLLPPQHETGFIYEGF